MPKRTTVVFEALTCSLKPRARNAIARSSIVIISNDYEWALNSKSCGGEGCQIGLDFLPRTQ
jgi:hypothetical protein